MPENVACPKCDRTLRVSENLLGKKVKCPACQTIFVAAAGGTPSNSGSVAKAKPKPSPVDDDDFDGDDLSRKKAKGEPADDDDDFDDDGRPRRRMDDDLADISNDYSINVGKCFNIASAHYGAVLGPMIGMMFVGMLMAIPIALIPSCVTLATAGLGRAASLAGSFLGNLFVTPLIMVVFGGFYYVALAQLKGKSWTFGDFFAGFKKATDLMIIGFVNALINLICMVPAISCLAAGLILKNDLLALMYFPMLLVGMLASGLILTKTCAFAPMLIFDRDLSGMDAIKANMKLAEGHLLGIFGFLFLVGLLAFAGVFACLIGLLFSGPYAILLYAACYLYIAGTEPPLNKPGRGGSSRRRDEEDDDDEDYDD